MTLKGPYESTRRFRGGHIILSTHMRHIPCFRGGGGLALSKTIKQYDFKNPKSRAVNRLQS